MKAIMLFTGLICSLLAWYLSVFALIQVNAGKRFLALGNEKRASEIIATLDKLRLVLAGLCAIASIAGCVALVIP